MSNSANRPSLTKKIKFNFNVNFAMIFTVLVLLFIAASQNRLVSAFINGNALPAKEDAAQLNFMLRDIGLQISMMQASRNTFDLNAANYQLQQDFLRLDEVLYRLNQYELDEQLIAALREAAADVKESASQTLNLYQRKMEREKLRDNALKELLLLKQNIVALEVVNDEQWRWVSLAEDAIHLMLTSLTYAQEIQVKPLEIKFVEVLTSLNKVPVSDPSFVAHHNKINQLGTGNNSVFALIYQVVSLDYAAKSNFNINQALQGRFVNLGVELFDQNHLATQSSVRQGTKISFYLVMLAIAVALVLLFRLTQAQQFLMTNIMLRLIRAKKTIKYNAQSENLDGWKEGQGKEPESPQDEISNVLAECEQLFKRMQLRNEELQVLSEVGRDFSGAANVEELLKRMNERVEHFSTGDAMLLGLWQPQKQEYDFPIGQLLNDELRGKKFVEQAATLVNELGIRENNIHVLNKKDLRPYVNNLSGQNLKDIGSLLFLTLKRHNNTFLGCLCLTSYEENGFSAGQINSMETLARYVAIAIENATTHSILGQVQGKLHLLEKMTGIKALGRDEAGNMLQAASEQVNKVGSLNFSVTELISGLDGQTRTDKQSDIHLIKERLEEVANNAKELEAKLIQMRGLSENEGESESDVELRQLIEINVGLLEQKFSHIHFKLEDLDEVKLRAKKEGLSQAIQDVLLNSCLAIKQRLEKSRDFTPSIKVSSFFDNKMVIIRIIDNGQGLPEAASAKILEPDFNPFHFSAGERFSLAVANATIKELSGDLVLRADDAKSNRTEILFPFENGPKNTNP